jgi:mannose-6-phosphate isomerase-like protein (cupin superfamily)
MRPAPIFLRRPETRLPSGTTVRITSRETGGAYCVCEMTTMPGDGVPLHIHNQDDEFYYILEGAYEIRAGDKRFTAEAGSMVVIPRNVPHRFHNAGDVAARALMIFHPGGFDELIGEVREAAVAGAVDEQRRHAILKKWGVTFLDEEP